jgi:hypothetical protein
MSKTDPSKAAQDNRANQLNSTHPAYYRSRGASESEAVEQAGHSKPVQDNHANQLNSTSEAYQTSRGKGEAKGR